MSSSRAKTIVPEDVLARIPRLKARLEASASGYVRVSRFSIPDRTALAVLIDRGEVEIIRKPFGNAYALKKGPA